MTVNPNDPCPCGSNKEYRECCLSTGIATPEVQYHYRQLSTSYEKLEERLGEHAYRVFGQDGPAVALDKFLGWPEGEELVEADFLDRQGALFWPWFLFNWEYPEDEDEFELDGPPEKTIAELYVEEQGADLDTTEQKLITAINRKPYSFWDVTGVVPGSSIDLQDILTGVRITALEKSGSQTVQPSDIVFGRVVAVDEIGMIFGIGSTILPPAIKGQLIQFQRKLVGEKRTLTNDDLLDRDVEIRRFYFDVELSLIQAPVLQHTDLTADKGSFVKPFPQGT